MKYVVSDQPIDGVDKIEKSASTAFSSSLLRFAGDIKIAHSIFALPFAATALGMIPLPQLKVSQLVLLLFSMIGARSFAMGINRFLDREIDAANPRTCQRQIPGGRLRAQHGLIWSVIFALLFVVSAFCLNTLSGILSIPVLLILCGYSYMKLVSWMTHWYLGFCLGIAPIAVSIAVTGQIFPQVIAIGVAVMFWTAGFDILYALQDQNFDIEHGYHSIPAKFGIKAAINISQACFVMMIVSLIVAGILIPDSGALYFSAVGAVASILVYEHYLIREVKITGTLAHINSAFFTANAWVSVVFYVLVQLDKLI